MKSFFICFFLLLSINSISQGSDCYSIIIKGATICNSLYKWKEIKVTASKEQLFNFLRENKFLHSCEYLLLSEEQIFERFKKADCPAEIIKIEFEEPKDILQLYKDLKENNEKEKKSGENKNKEDKGENKNKENTIKTSELKVEEKEPPAIEMCINSNGEISLSFSNEIGSFQVTSKGKFSISVKGKDDKEYKVGL